MSRHHRENPEDPIEPVARSRPSGVAPALGNRPLDYFETAPEADLRAEAGRLSRYINSSMGVKGRLEFVTRAAERARAIAAIARRRGWDISDAGAEPARESVVKHIIGESGLQDDFFERVKAKVNTYLDAAAKNAAEGDLRVAAAQLSGAITYLHGIIPAVKRQDHSPDVTAMPWRRPR